MSETALGRTQTLPPHQMHAWYDTARQRMAEVSQQATLALYFYQERQQELLRRKMQALERLLHCDHLVSHVEAHVCRLKSQAEDLCGRVESDSEEASSAALDHLCSQLRSLCSECETSIDAAMDAIQVRAERGCDGTCGRASGGRVWCVRRAESASACMPFQTTLARSDCQLMSLLPAGCERTLARAGGRDPFAAHQGAAGTLGEAACREASGAGLQCPPAPSHAPAPPRARPPVLPARCEPCCATQGPSFRPQQTSPQQVPPPQRWALRRCCGRWRRRRRGRRAPTPSHGCHPGSWGCPGDSAFTWG